MPLSSPRHRLTSPPLEMAPPTPPVTPLFKHLPLDMWSHSPSHDSHGSYVDVERNLCEGNALGLTLVPPPERRVAPLSPLALALDLPFSLPLSQLMSDFAKDVHDALRGVQETLQPFTEAAFLPLPDRIRTQAGQERCDNPYLPTTRPSTPRSWTWPSAPSKTRSWASPPSMLLPLSKADFAESSGEWVTAYLASLALFIWAAVLWFVVRRGLVGELWSWGEMDVVGMWEVADEVLGFAGL